MLCAGGEGEGEGAVVGGISTQPLERKPQPQAMAFVEGRQKRGLSCWDRIDIEGQIKLLETKIADVMPRSRCLVIAKSTDSVAQVFSRLVDNRILSVPLLQTATNRYMAFVDVTDILALLVKLVDVELPPEALEEAAHSLFTKTPSTELIGQYVSLYDMDRIPKYKLFPQGFAVVVEHGWRRRASPNGD